MEVTRKMATVKRQRHYALKQFENMTETEAFEMVKLIEKQGLINIVASVRPRIIIKNPPPQALTMWDGGNTYPSGVPNPSRWEIQEREDIVPLFNAIVKHSLDSLLIEQARMGLRLIEIDIEKAPGYREEEARLAERMAELGRRRKSERERTW
jgi:hypothetical protein